MPFLTVRVQGVEEFRARISRVRADLPVALARSIQTSCAEMTAALTEAAPQGRGASGSESAQPSGLLEGDAAGPLKLSFESEVTTAGTSRVVGVVRTTQPRKLRLVREGRGVVTPREKRALMWEGLDHPVPRAGPAAPNDFVTPVVEAQSAAAIERIRTDLASVFAAS